MLLLWHKALECKNSPRVLMQYHWFFYTRVSKTLNGIRNETGKHVCLGFSFHSRSFHSNEDVTNTGKGVQILTYARHIWPLSSDGSLACHTSVTSWPPNSADRERILLFETGFYKTVYLQKDIYTHTKTAQWFFNLYKYMYITQYFSRIFLDISFCI